MERIGISKECENLELIIETLVAGKETSDIGDSQYSLDDVIEYLRGFLQDQGA